MRGALVILIAMIIIGIMLYVTDILFYSKQRKEAAERARNNSALKEEESASNQEEDQECCGLHLVCEKTGLSPVTDEIIYYDDEELDRFKDKDPATYTPDETEEFRDILLTLLPDDLAGWSKSLQLRNIAMPQEIRDEFIILITEVRDGRSRG